MIRTIEVSRLRQRIGTNRHPELLRRRLDYGIEVRPLRP